MAKHADDAPKPRWIISPQGHKISCQHNALLWLHDHGFQGQIGLDTFRQVVTIEGQPLSDEVVIELVRQIEADLMIRMAQDHVRSAVLLTFT